jgi:hypothetical protein
LLCLHLKEGGLGYARELTVVFKLTNCLWIYGQDVFEQRLSVEFRTEVDMLSQVDHLNLVKLIGYMEENSERILVVEYVPNGNLREHLDGTLPTYIRTDLDTFPQFFISLVFSLHLMQQSPSLCSSLAFKKWTNDKFLKPLPFYAPKNPKSRDKNSVYGGQHLEQMLHSNQGSQCLPEH